PARYAAKIKAPVFIIHAKDDEIIRYKYSQEVYYAIPHNAKTLYITDWGAKHCHSLNVKPREYNAYLDDFFTKHVRM
ncbi:MAG: alpha/beta hydrolase, partial [Spirochaetia bacterium]|nr:alpha/beta hydrolase [Spirochaetia bacterium]